MDVPSRALASQSTRPAFAPVRAVAWIWQNTLNSVGFGILLMVALAVYIAVGSAFPSLRAWFEMTDLQFFNAWPMVLLSGLLVLNLLTVSFSRIPFTLPRLGVWTIHAGIIVLIFGLLNYFWHKTEGMTLVRVGEKVDWYYDSAERALYVKSDSRKAIPLPLPELPRFSTYDAIKGNDNELRDRGLSGLTPLAVRYDEATRQGLPVPFGSEGDPVTLDVLGYYPYAVVGSDYAVDGGDLTGLKLTLRATATGEERVQWAVARQPGHAFDTQTEQQVATVRVRHLHRDDDLTGDGLLKGAKGGRTIEWHVGDHGSDDAIEGTITPEPGERIALGDTGYEVEVVAALPGFPLFGSSEPVDALELLVHPPKGSPHGETFRRYVLDGIGTQTDFVLGVDGAGPKGQRQDSPVDPTLHLHYRLTDGLGLLPRSGEDERHTILTKQGESGLYHLVTRNDAPASVESIESGQLQLAVDGEIVDPDTGVRQPYRLELDIDRADGVARRTWVAEVPQEQRDNSAAQAGTFQVVSVRVARGDWSDTVHVPYTQWPDQAPWQPAQVDVPGLTAPLELQLANTRLPAPAQITLESFELVPYAGDFTSNSAMRDFRSNLTVDPIGPQEGFAAQAKLNNPVYLDIPVAGPLADVWPAQSWLLFQSQWDPERQAFTVLGVANRPGITTMVVGCVMIVLGLMWAFYVKPALLRRRKRAALAAVGR